MPSFIIHPDFKLQDRHFNSHEALLDFVAKNLPQDLSFLQDLFDTKAYIWAHTSGSTGTPKQIKIKKQYLINSALKTIDFFELHSKTKALLNLSSDYIAGKMMWARALIGGWHLDVCAPDHRSIEAKLATQHYDFGAMVPLQVHQNLSFVSNISKLIIGGGAVLDILQKRLNDLPNQIFATYGMTETITHIAIRPLNKMAANNFYKQKKQVGSYRILKGIDISKDQRNCLVIEAPDLSGKKIVTNDLVKIIDQRHFVWLGRYDNIINSGGIKFIPEQIEDKLKKHLKNNFFIAGLPDNKLGQKIVLLIEGKIDKTKLTKVFEQTLEPYEKPKEIIEIPEFYRTDSGKIQRKKTIDSIKYY